MHTLIGVALSLVLGAGHNGSNGFDPTSVVLLNQGGRLVIDEPTSTKFLQWLDNGPPDERARRASAVAYFIACALDDGTEIRLRNHLWRGAMGLASTVQSSIRGLRPLTSGEAPPPARTKDGAHGARSPSRAHLVLTADEGKWVSACLMAFANMRGSHQYIQLRGNPPVWRTGPTPGERWTMGYPEGVFFADILNFNVGSKDGQLNIHGDPERPTRADLERSFTLSLNLPSDYPGPANPPWAPPNASNGRTCDFQKETTWTLPAPIGAYRVAEKLGAYLPARHLFMGPRTPVDPDYASDAVCVRDRKVVDCGSNGAETYRPLFVHAPRVVGLASASASATNVADASLTIQALDTGPTRLDDVQQVTCVAEDACTGPFTLTAVGGTPTAPPPSKPKMLVRLREKQSVVTVLLFDSEREHYQLDMDEPFTAIVRYRSPVDAAARVEVGDGHDGWRDAGVKIWPKTGKDWEWMQIFPVHAFRDTTTGGDRPALKVRISGSGDGTLAPTLDLAGFVSGPPWCGGNDCRPFADVCRDDKGGRLPMVRSARAFRAE